MTDLDRALLRIERIQRRRKIAFILFGAGVALLAVSIVGRIFWPEL